MDVITRCCQAATSRLRIAFYRAQGVNIQGRICLRAVEIPRNHKAITLEDGVALDRGVVLLATHADARIVIRAQCYINRHTFIDASEAIEIGARCMVGPFCYLTDHDHAFSSSSAPADGPLTTAPTRLGERCWIGAHVTVLKGVTIGEGTVVGAGGVVTKSLPARVLAVGNPARVVRELT